jgi:hypothetical protein
VLDRKAGRTFKKRVSVSAWEVRKR